MHTALIVFPHRNQHFCCSFLWCAGDSGGPNQYGELWPNLMMFSETERMQPGHLDVTVPASSPPEAEQMPSAMTSLRPQGVPCDTSSSLGPLYHFGWEAVGFPILSQQLHMPRPSPSSIMAH